jgi:hypothetical protein
MTLKELKERALVSADEIGNEIEYADQLVEAINKVQNKLCVFARNKIRYRVVVENEVIDLPDDCYELISVTNKKMEEVDYIKLNNHQIKVGIDGEYVLKYKAFLPNITKETEDEFEIEIEPIAESCMVAGVASWIAIDNPEIYDVLNNEYNNLLANLSQIPETVNEHTNGIARIGGWYW